jgi:hypothetical protein
MNATEEATINTDGTSSTQQPLTENYTSNGTTTNSSGGEEFDDQSGFDTEDVVKAAIPGIDPAVYVLLAVIILSALYYYFVYRKKSTVDEDTFFSNLDGDKVSAALFNATNHL